MTGTRAGVTRNCDIVTEYVVGPTWWMVAAILIFVLGWFRSDQPQAHLVGMAVPDHMIRPITRDCISAEH